MASLNNTDQISWRAILVEINSLGAVQELAYAEIDAKVELLSVQLKENFG